MKSIYLAFLITIMLIISSNCGASHGITETTNLEITATVDREVLSTTLPYIHKTASTTLIPTTINKSTPINTTYQSLTPTIISTLPIEVAQTRLLSLLSTNGGCSLPCLFGITPGITTEQDAGTILIPLSSISDFTALSPGVGAIAPNLKEGDLIISINIGFLTTDKKVNRVAFEARALKEMTEQSGIIGVFNSKLFGERLSLYMLPQILTQYGRPSTVLLMSLAEPPSPTRGGDIGYFRIILIYPDKGILVNYVTTIGNIGENVVGCPADAHVRLELYLPGNGSMFMENLDPSWQESIKANYMPLEDVTQFSIDDFYQTFRQPTDKCIETPANLWPVPER